MKAENPKPDELRAHPEVSEEDLTETEGARGDVIELIKDSIKYQEEKVHKRTQKTQKPRKYIPAHWSNGVTDLESLNILAKTYRAIRETSKDPFVEGTTRGAILQNIGATAENDEIRLFFTRAENAGLLKIRESEFNSDNDSFFLPELLSLNFEPEETEGSTDEGKMEKETQEDAAFVVPDKQQISEEERSSEEMVYSSEEISDEEDTDEGLIFSQEGKVKEGYGDCGICDWKWDKSEGKKAILVHYQSEHPDKFPKCPLCKIETKVKVKNMDRHFAKKHNVGVLAEVHKLRKGRRKREGDTRERPKKQKTSKEDGEVAVLGFVMDRAGAAKQYGVSLVSGDIRFCPDEGSAK